MIQKELFFFFFPDYPVQQRRKDEEKISFREEKAWERIQFEDCCPEGRADGCHKGRSWDESQKEPGC